MMAILPNKWLITTFIYFQSPNICSFNMFVKKFFKVVELLSKLSKEPYQQKVNLGEVFILEASKNRTECGNERSSSYGTIEITVMMCEQYKPAKEKALQTRVTTHWQPWCLESICECTLKKCTFLYCCLKKRVLFNTFKLSNDLSSNYFFLNQIMHKCVNSFLPLQKYCLIRYKLQITAGLP